MILSSKSSGSSALQNLLTKNSHARHISRSRYNRHETLFWVEAASVLGLPQVDMLNSIVPIPAAEARADLIKLLTENLIHPYIPPRDDRELIFDGWLQLCQRYAPVFLEKSPHHLHQWSALELIVECIEKLPNVDFLLIGLVRNPMDTLYSMWKRWKGDPEKNQYQWHTAYSNLLKLKEILSEKLIIIRYEDIVSNESCLQEVYDFIDAIDTDSNKYFHSKSLTKWKQDPLYDFNLSNEVIALAEVYGYRYKDMLNDNNNFFNHG